MSGLEIDELTTTEQLEALEPAWADLWHRAPAATPVQSPAWLIPWWRHVGGGALRVVAAHAGGRLVGLLPLYLQQEPTNEKLLPLGIAISDGRIVAVIYGLFAKRRAYCYMSGFDPDLAGISPGTLIVGHAIERAIGEHAREVDFLRGRERFWGARDQPCYGRMIRRAG